MGTYQLAGGIVFFMYISSFLLEHSPPMFDFNPWKYEGVPSLPFQFSRMSRADRSSRVLTIIHNHRIALRWRQGFVEPNRH